MKKLIWALLLFAYSARAQQIIPLYPEGKIPFAKEKTEVPKLTVYRPVKEKAKGTVVIVCSGGSYGGRANGVEGIPAAKKLDRKSVV